MGQPGCAPYSAAKAAVINLMESYYLNLKKYGIGVSVVCPTGIISNISESTYTRPEKYENTGYNVTDQTIDFMRYHYSFGIQPIELAQIIKKGVEDGILYIIPMKEPEKMLRANFERVIDWSTKEGMQRQDELEKKRQAERAANTPVNVKGGREAGWGSAKPDLKWVKPR